MGKKVEGQLEAYCVRCKAKRIMVKPVINVSKTGMNMAKGACNKCGCKMCKIMGKA